MKKEKVPYRRMMAYLDGELSPREAREFEQLMEAHPEWREQVKSMADVVGATSRLKLRRPDPTTWDRYWEEIDSRLQRRLGWVLLLIGGLSLMLLGIVKVFALADNWMVQSSMLLVLLGMAVLFFAVLRGRLLEVPRDRYGKVRR